MLFCQVRRPRRPVSPAVVDASTICSRSVANSRSSLSIFSRDDIGFAFGYGLVNGVLFRAHLTANPYEDLANGLLAALAAFEECCIEGCRFLVGHLLNNPRRQRAVVVDDVLNLIASPGLFWCHASSVLYYPAFPK